jgi:hypothetical protein
VTKRVPARLCHPVLPIDPRRTVIALADIAVLAGGAGKAEQLQGSERQHGRHARITVPQKRRCSIAIRRNERFTTFSVVIGRIIRLQWLRLAVPNRTNFPQKSRDFPAIALLRPEPI